MTRSQPFTADDLVACYRAGVFPMAEGREDEVFHLVDPPERGIIPLGGFRLSRRLARTLRASPFSVRVDTAFDQVVEACAASAPGRTETWISHPIQSLYRTLFSRGLAHSVECWTPEGEFAGGLYGVALGGAFFGESMVSFRRDASKLALAHLVGRLQAGGFQLLDIQFVTEHLLQFGAEEISRADYRRRLAKALEAEADFYALPAQLAGAAVLQAISQTS